MLQMELCLLVTPGSAVAYSGSEGYATIANVSGVGNQLNLFNLHFDNSYSEFVPIGSDYDTAEVVAQTAYQAYWANYITGLYWNEGKKVTMDLYFTPDEYKDIELNDRINYPKIKHIGLIKYQDLI